MSMQNNLLIEFISSPVVRIWILLLSTLAIGFGSWFGASTQIDSCSFKSTMSLQQVHLFQNISSDITIPNSVTFGLWKSCYIYSLNCSCSSTSLTYYSDVSSILQTALKGNTTIPAPVPTTTSTSLIRVIPLLLATLFSVLAFATSFYKNKKGIYLQHRILVILILVTLFLVSLSFGYSYHSYYEEIVKTCQSSDNNLYCTKNVVRTEAVLLSLALGLLSISILSWCLKSGLSSKSANGFVSEANYTHVDGSQKVSQKSKMKNISSKDEKSALWGDMTKLGSEKALCMDEQINNRCQENTIKSDYTQPQLPLISLDRPYANKHYPGNKKQYRREPVPHKKRQSRDLHKMTPHRSSSQPNTQSKLNGEEVAAINNMPGAREQHAKNHVLNNSLQGFSYGHFPQKHDKSSFTSSLDCMSLVNSPNTEIEHPSSKNIIRSKRA